MVEHKIFPPNRSRYLHVHAIYKRSFNYRSERNEARIRPVIKRWSDKVDPAIEMLATKIIYTL